MLENPSSTHPDFDETWRRIELLVDEIAQWAKNAASCAEFYELLLQRTVAELKVPGGAVWSWDSRSGLQRIDMIGSPAIDAMTQRPAHLEQIEDLFAGHSAGGRPSTEARRLTHAPGEGSISSLAPVIVDDQTVAILELVLAAETTATSRENAEHVMAALTDVAVDFHRAAQLRDLQQQVGAWDAAQDFSDCVHRRLDLNETCYAIANEGRRYVGADRVSLLVGRCGSLRVRAISGVETIDRRSPEVVLLRRLAGAVAQFGESLWTQDAIDRPPQIQQLLDAYHDASGVSCLAVIPIYAELPAGKPRFLGVLVVEQFKGDTFEAAVKTRLAICCRHARTSLANALEMNSLPLLWVSRGVRTVGWLFGFQSLLLLAVAMTIGLLLVGAGITALCVVPVDFTITARGHLQPIHQQDIFAPADGVVQQVLVQHSQEVLGDEVLVRLRNSELDYETERLVGDLATTRSQLMTVQGARVLDGRDRQKVVQHNAEIERLKQVLTGMNRQFEILRRQRDNLGVRAPFAGQVMSWDAEKLLASRPVRQGQRLMTIADVHGPWQLEVDIPDEEIGHVLAARQQHADGALPVTFILLTDPATSHRGAIAEVALGTVITRNDEPAVEVTVAIDVDALASPRPGAGVVTRIHCGRRAIGYVWFRRFYEKLRRRLML